MDSAPITAGQVFELHQIAAGTIWPLKAPCWSRSAARSSIKARWALPIRVMNMPGIP